MAQCANSCIGSCQCCVQINCCGTVKMPRTLTWQKISHFTGLPIDTATLTWNGTHCQWEGTSPTTGKIICFFCQLAPNEVWNISTSPLDANQCCTVVECTSANQTVSQCAVPRFVWDPCGGAGNFEQITA